MKDIEFRHLIGIGSSCAYPWFCDLWGKYWLERGKDPWRVPDNLQLNSEINPWREKRRVKWNETKIAESLISIKPLWASHPCTMREKEKKTMTDKNIDIKLWGETEILWTDIQSYLETFSCSGFAPIHTIRELVLCDKVKCQGISTIITQSVKALKWPVQCLQ